MLHEEFKSTNQNRKSGKSEHDSSKEPTSKITETHIIPINSHDLEPYSFYPSEKEFDPLMLEFLNRISSYNYHSEPENENVVVYLNSETFEYLKENEKQRSRHKGQLSSVVLICSALITAYLIYNRGAYDPGHECDLLASAPWDIAKPAELRGVDFEAIIGDRAKEACSAAVKRHPKNARYHFQLGRVFDHKEKYKLAASQYYLSLANDSKYAAANLNLGILYEHGQPSAETMSQQITKRNTQEATLKYQEAANYGLPYGRYCYAIALILGWGGSRNVQGAKEQLNLAKIKLGHLTRSYGYSDPKLMDKINDFLHDIDSPDKLITHVSCDPRNGIAIENDPQSFP